MQVAELRGNVDVLIAVRASYVGYRDPLEVAKQFPVALLTVNTTLAVDG